MKKLLFIPFLFLIFLLGCKGGPDVPEQFDIEKINLDYSMDSQYSDYKGLELYKKISDGNNHYLFYIRNHFNESIKVYYDKNYLGFIPVPLDDYNYYKETLNEKYFNLEFNLEEPETFSDYSYEFEIKNNKIHYIILPTVKLTSNLDNSNLYKYFIDSDEYPLFFSNNEKNIEIGFNFEENIFKGNCVDGVYNFTDFKDLSNMRYCYPGTFLYGTNSYVGEKRDYITTILYNIKTSDEDFRASYKKLIGLEYEYDSDLDYDYELMERIIEYNEDPSDYTFNNSDYSIEHHNFIKNHGTVYNISCDKFNFKNFENEYKLCLNAKLKNIELYELYNNKYTSILLSKEDFKSLYDYIDNNGLNISINDIEFSPYENKIIGCRFYEYCY